MLIRLMGTLRTWVSACLVLGACSAPEPTARPHVPDDPSDILLTVVAYFADSTEVPIAVLDTSFRAEMGSDPLPNSDSLHVFIDVPDSALVATFIREVQSGFPIPIPDRADVIRSPSFPRDAPIDHSALPEGRALGLTRPAISGDGSTAILEYVLNCNAVFRGNCGRGGFLVLELREGSWVVVRDEDRWIA